jgi:DNA polymerase V
MKILDTCEIGEGTVEVPLYASLVAAGLTAWSDDHIDTYFSLDASIVKRSSGVYCVKVSGDSMIGSNISPGDILVVDANETNYQSKIVIASVDGETTVKRYMQHGKKVYLVPANPKYPTLEVNLESNFRVLGVVTHVIREAL